MSVFANMQCSWFCGCILLSVSYVCVCLLIEKSRIAVITQATAESLQLIDVYGKVKYIIYIYIYNYEGYGVTIYTLLLATLDFKETRNVRLSLFCAVHLLLGYTSCTLWAILVGAVRSKIQCVQRKQWSDSNTFFSCRPGNFLGQI